MASFAPPTAPPLEPVRYAVVGSGWRAQFFLRMSRALPEWVRLTGVVTRTAERGAEVEARWGVPTHRSVKDLLAWSAADRPELVVTSTPWDVTPGVIRAVVRADVPVLAETPPAPDVAAMRALWADVGASGLVQVAEHSPFLPGHVARGAVVDAGLLGGVTSVHVSSTHQYHAVALMRRLLGVGFAPVEVVGRRFEAPLMDLRTRAGWTGATEARPVENRLAILDWGEGRSALYDFTHNQPRNDLRTDRLLVRGSHGELADDVVQRWVDPQAVVTSRLERRHAGLRQDMERYDVEHVAFEGGVLWRNPFLGARLSEDDLAVATLLTGAGAWVRGAGAPPYPLAEGLQDHLVGEAIMEATRTRAVVRTTVEPWASH